MRNCYVVGSEFISSHSTGKGYVTGRQNVTAAMIAVLALTGGAVFAADTQITSDENGNVTWGYDTTINETGPLDYLNASGTEVIDYENVTTKYSTAWGINTVVGSRGATAWGLRSQALAGYATAWGQETVADKYGATAWGYKAKASDTLATAWGNSTLATGYAATAWGCKAADSDALGASGNFVTSYGLNMTASGMASTAWGSHTKASDMYATAWGNAATASGHASTAWGYKTNAEGKLATAWGNSSVATGLAATAWGVNTNASGNYATAWGLNANASGDYATAWGYNTNAAGMLSTAFGANSAANGYASTAFGNGSAVYGDNSFAALGGTVGEGSVTTGENGTKVVTTTKAVNNSAAIGNGAQVLVDDTLALGSGSVADRDYTSYTTAAAFNTANSTDSTWKANANAIAVGNGTTTTRQITGLAAGSADTDAVNVAQLKSAVGGLSTTDYSVVEGTYSVNKTGSVNLTVKDRNDENAEAEIVTIDGIAVVYDNNKNLISTNSGLNESATSAIALGKDAGGASYSVSIGDYSQENGIGATVLGTNSKITNDNTEFRQIYQNALSTATGAMNKIETTTDAEQKVYAGVTNSISGAANTITDSNGVVIQGTGNTVTGAYNDMKLDEKDYAAILKGDYSTLVKKDSGAVAVIGGANTVSNTTYTTDIGFGNTISNSKDVFTAGSYNKLDKVTNGVILGNSVEMSNVDGVVSLGNNNEVTANNAVALGNGAKVSEEGGVALGVDSVADTASKKRGYMADDNSNDPVWYANAAAVSVGVSTTDENGNVKATTTRQITNVAAGTELTDAVNVAQLKRAAMRATTHVKAGANVIVSEETDKDKGYSVYTVNAKGTTVTGDKNIIKTEVNTTDEDGNITNTEYQLKLANTVTIGEGTNPVKIDGTKGTVNGLTNTTWSENYVITSGQAATEDQLQAVKQSIEDASYKGWKVSTNKNTAGVEQMTKAVDSEDVVDFSNSDGNIVISQNGTDIALKLADNVKTNTVTVGKDGENGADGSITIVNKDGTNTSITITKDGKPGVDGKDGESTTRIVYDNKQIANLDDGMKFAGDRGDTIAKKLNETLSIKGGATGTLTDGNIGVVSEGGVLNVKLAENVDLGENGSVTTGKTVINNNGLTIGGEGATQVVIQQNYVSMGSTQIHNVLAGTADTDAVNYGQLKNVETTAKAHNTVEAADNNITVDSKSKNADGGTIYKVGLADKVTIGSGDNAVSIDGTAATIMAGDITLDGANGTAKIGNVTINGADGNSTITGLTNQTIDYKGFADGSGRAATEEQLSKVISDTDAKVKAATTEVVEGNNVTVEKVEPAAADGHTTYKVSAYDTQLTAGKNVSLSGGKLDEATGVRNYTVALSDDVNVTSITATTVNSTTVNATNAYVTNVDETNDNSVINKSYFETNNKNIAPGEYSVQSDGTVTMTYVDGAGNAVKGETAVIKDVASKAQQDINTTNIYNNSIAINQISGDVNRLDSRIKRVGAGAAALAALHPLDFDPDAKWDFAAGYGNYRGASAAAVGAYYRPNEDTMFSVGGSFGGGENMINAGVSLKIGASSSHVNTSKVAMAKEIKDMRAELEALKSALLDANAGKKLDTSKLQLFPDVPENHWAYEYVATLAGNGIIEGYPDGNFSGDRPMTRYEFAAILYRAMLNGATLSDKVLAEFAPELERFTVDTIYKDKDGNATVERVRTVKNAK